jgi:hypothetical protein
MRSDLGYHLIENVVARIMLEGDGTRASFSRMKVITVFFK